jgi:hypothetical protein
VEKHYKKTTVFVFHSFKDIPKRYYITLLLFITNLMEGYVMTNMSVVLVDITSEKRIVRGNNQTEILVSKSTLSVTRAGLAIKYQVSTGCLAARVCLDVHRKRVDIGRKRRRTNFSMRERNGNPYDRRSNFPQRWQTGRSGRHVNLSGDDERAHIPEYCEQIYVRTFRGKENTWFVINTSR